MKWSRRFFRLMGTEVRVHASFLLVFVIFPPFPLLLDFSLLNLAIGLGSYVAALALVFGLVLLHEFGHVLAARSVGIGAPMITLWPLGGLAHLEREPERPRDQLWVSAAGPLVNLALAGLAFVVAFALNMSLFSFLLPLPFLPSPELTTPITTTFVVTKALLELFAGVNLLLALFNLIPAYPLDGGHILRALLLMTVGPTWSNPITSVFSGLGGVAMIVFGFFLYDWIMIVLGLLLVVVFGPLPPKARQFVNVRLAYFFDQGVYYTHTKNYLPAMQFYDRKLAEHPDKMTINDHINHSLVASRLKDYPRCIASAERGLALEPDDPEVRATLYTNRGVGHYYLDNLEQAEADYEQARDYAPAFGLIYNNLASVWLKRNDLSQARTLVDTALEHTTDMGALYITRAAILHLLGLHAEALADAQQALKLEQTEEGYYFVQGSILYAQGEQQRALQVCDEMVKRKLPVVLPECTDVLVVVTAYPAWARAYYARMLELRPNDALTHSGRGAMEFALGDLDAALADFERALALKPDLGHAYLGRGQVCAQQLYLTEAIADFERARKHADNAFVHYRAGRQLADLAVPVLA